MVTDTELTRRATMMLGALGHGWGWTVAAGRDAEAVHVRAVRDGDTVLCAARDLSGAVRLAAGEIARQDAGAPKVDEVPFFDVEVTKTETVVVRIAAETATEAHLQVAYAGVPGAFSGFAGFEMVAGAGGTEYVIGKVRQISADELAGAGA